MILVLLGTQNNDFSRLLIKLDVCIEKGIITDNVIVQAGYTKYHSNNMKIFDFISKNEINNLIKSSDLIITHGGVGSIMKGIKLSKKVIAVPRLQEYNEHVNNHQVQIIENFNSLGYIKGVIDLNNLEDVLKNINTFVPIPFKNNNSRVIDLVYNYIKSN